MFTMRYVFLLFSFTLTCGYAQHKILRPTNGVKTKATIWYAFVNGVVHTDAGTAKKVTLLVKDGRIEKVGGVIKYPKETVEIDLKGQHIYPSLIDLYSGYGLAKPKGKKYDPKPQLESSKLGAFSWNESIKAEIRAAASWSPNEKEAKDYRKNGFGFVLSQSMDGICRGTSALVSTGKGEANQLLVLPDAAAHYSFSKGTSRQTYPSSLMGAIALLRQTYYDAAYYQENQDDLDRDLTLEAFNQQQLLPQIFEANDQLNILRADKVGEEFNVQYIFKGKGDEYQQIAAIKATNGALILPINFPKAYEVSDPYAARLVSLEQMKHWELAPGNLLAVEQAGIPFCITLNGLKDKADFWKNIRKAIARGLSREAALRALTETPAKLLNMESEIGKLNAGMRANFLITSGEIFEPTTVIRAHWIDGTEYIVQPEVEQDIRGTYILKMNEQERTLKVVGTKEKPSATVEYKVVVDSIAPSGDLVLDEINKKPIKVTRTKKVKTVLGLKGRQVSLSYQLTDGLYSLSGVVHTDSGIWRGNGTNSKGTWMEWAAIKKEKFKAEKKKAKTIEPDTLNLGSVTYPMMAYGFDSLPKQQSILIQNATLWTLEQQGTLEQTDLLLQDGKIKKIGKILDVADPNAIVIDGTGMHVTPGIIDEHSHIAISRGVNESGQASSAEASIATVVNSNDVNIYRQLAGGVTSAQLLHGSANPIGGQSAIIKLRWGSLPEDMKYANMPKFIKFALGENVKQSNWGDYNSVRFPQTRMGVEQVYYDHFIRAKAYMEEWNNLGTSTGKRRGKDSGGKKPHTDLELEVLAEILRKERFVSCHSYVQSEINMLMNVADSMGFTLNTFTHILEGYKVADKMKAHNAGGSTFSDWWAYKYEVNDAIPHNASLMNQMGILTAINSDDAEMARRLNQEAAKGMKYGGMTPEEALKMITINPAKLLHIEDRVGSILEGKDADIVLWTAHPLSIYAQVSKTIVDGKVYFDQQRDREMRKAIAEERTRLVQKMLKAKLGGAETQAPNGKKSRVHNCNIFIDEGNE